MYSWIYNIAASASGLSGSRSCDGCWLIYFLFFVFLIINAKVHVCKTFSVSMAENEYVISGSLLSVVVTPACRPAHRYTASNESAAQKAEYVDLLRCARGQSLDVTLQRQQKRQQQRHRPQSPRSHESSLRWKQRPLQSREQRRRSSRLSGHRTSVQRRPSHSKSRNLGRSLWHFGKRPPMSTSRSTFQNKSLYFKTGIVNGI